MTDTLKKKTVKGIGWSAIDQLVNQGVTFVVGIVLANLLTPYEYGLIGIITIFIQLFYVFIVSGFNTALIRKNDATDQDYSTVFLFNTAVSLLLFVVLWLIAPWIADFFERTELVTLSRAMGIILIINALALVPTTILTKQIDFKKQAKISLIASITSGAIGIGMAFMGYGVWSLVGQQISRQGLNAAFLWIWVKWRPILRFSKKSFDELWGFGWKILVSSLIDNFWKEIYQIIVGKCYLPQTLGQYTRAQQFAGLFSINITTLVQRVSYPVLSSIQDDKERLRECYRKVIKSTMLVTFVCMFTLAAIARPMVLTLIGEKWAECIIFLQIICFGRMLYPLHALNLNILQVEGRSDLYLRLEIIKKAIAVVPILLGIFYSIYAMIIGSTITSFIGYYLNAYYSGPLLNYGIWAQIKDLLPALGIALGVSVPVYGLSFLPLAPIIVLGIQLLAGMTIGLVLLENVRMPEYAEIRNVALSTLSKILKRS